MRTRISPPLWSLAIMSLLAMQAIHIVWRGWNYYFFTDDFVNFFFARDEGLTLHYLGHSVFGQFAPGFRLGQWLFTKTFGLSFWGNRLFDMVCLGGSLALILRLAVIQRTQWRVVRACAALAIFSPIFIMNYQWLASSMHVLPSAFFSLATLLTIASRQVITWRQRLLAAMFYTLGLLFYAKTLLLLPLLLAVRMFLLTSANTVPAWRAVLRSALIDIAPMLPIAAVYLVIIIRGHFGDGVRHPGPILLVEFLWAAWSQGLLCNTLGVGAWMPHRFIAANLLFFGIVFVSARRNPAVLLVWGGFLVTFLLGATAIAEARATIYGADIGTLPRYHADGLLILLACTMLVFRRSSPVQDALAVSQDRTWASAGSVEHQNWLYAVTEAAASVAFIWWLVAAGDRVALLWPYDDGRVYTYISNLRTTFARLPAGAEILDTKLPNYILPEIVPALDTMRVMKKLIRTRAGMTTDPAAGLVIDEQGHLAGRTPPDPISSEEDEEAHATTSDCFLDTLGRQVPQAAPISVSTPLQASGWGAVAARSGSVADRIDLILTAATTTIEHSAYVVSTHSVLRGDLVKEFRQPALRNAGFSVFADTSKVAPGQYHLSLRLAEGSRAWRCDLKQVIIIAKLH
jgi:hypothetical protein